MLILQQMRDISEVWSHLPSLLRFSVKTAGHDCMFIECTVQPKHIQTDQQRAVRPFFAIEIKERHMTDHNPAIQHLCSVFYLIYFDRDQS